MRIFLIGQAPFGEAVLKRLLEQGEAVVGVSAPAPKEGAKPDPLWAGAHAKGLPLFGTRDLKRHEVFDRYAALEADLCVMAYVTDILPERVLFQPRLQSIQYHPSLLPLHRGASAMNWAIWQGRAKTGLTIFWPDKGIDTGPILLQKECAITPDDTLGSLYFNKLFPMGVEAIAEAVKLVRTGKAPRTPQDHARATYEPIAKEEHAQVRWDLPASMVYTIIRGANPQPGAWTTYKGAKLKLFDCKLLSSESVEKPGRILSLTADGILVSSWGGALLLQRLQPSGGPKQSAAEYVAASGLAVGDCLGG